MKTRLFLLLGVSCALLACNNKEQVQSKTEQLPESDELTTRGKIIATFGCYQDENNKKESAYYEGCVIETTDKDTFLTFNFEQGLVAVNYGERIVSVDIPFAFAYTILDKDDDRYVTFDFPAQNAMLPMFPKPMDEVRQAVIRVE